VIPRETRAENVVAGEFEGHQRERDAENASNRQPENP